MNAEDDGDDGDGDGDDDGNDVSGLARRSLHTCRQWISSMWMQTASTQPILFLIFVVEA